MWIYNQSNGLLIKSGVEICTGYSGRGDGKNNTSMEQVPNVGPIPRGTYTISNPYDSVAHGPLVMSLSPTIGTCTYGRGGFLVHGDSVSHPGEASHGCIILPRNVREQIAQSPDREIAVI